MIISPVLEYYSLNNSSKLTKLNPVTKTILLIVYLFLNVWLKDYQYLIIFVLSLVIFYLAKVRIAYVKRAIIMALTLAIILFILRFFWWKSENLIYCITASLKIISGLLFILSYIATTSINQILSSLKTLKAPDIFLETFLLIYKYIFVINDDGLKLRDAQMVRLGYKDFKTSIKSMGTLWGALFLKTISRGEKIVDALNVRGYNGRIFYPSQLDSLKMFDITILIIAGVFPLLVLLI